MPRPTRRSVLAAAGAAGAAGLPRFAIAQADTRPALTVAVQKIASSGTLETPREQSNVGYRISYSYAETLIDSDWFGTLSPKPGLATAWRRIDDRTVEFDLRRDARFHDGRTMTAEDVAFSLGPRLFGGSPETDGGRALPREVPVVGKLTYPGLERMEIVRDGVVRYVNRVPDLTLEGRIQQNVGVVLSRAAFMAAPDYLAWARQPVGTGPYRIASFRPDVELILEAHDAYWGGRPPAKRIRVAEVPEAASRINGLLAGEFDFACDIPPDQIGVLEKDGRTEVLGSPINNIRIVTFDKNHPQLRDPRIRRAFTHALDRQAIVDALWAGRTRLTRGLQLDSYGDMFLRDWDSPAYDPAEARRLLKDAGYKGDPIPYRVLNNYYTAQVATAQIMVEMWKQAGLNVEIRMVENGQQQMDRSTPRGLRDWSNTSLFNDPVAGLIRGMSANGQLQQEGEWTNEEFNRLSPELESSTDPARRRAVFRRLLEIIEREDPGYIVLHQAATFTAKRRGIRWRAANGWALDFRPARFITPQLAPYSIERKA